MYGQKKERRVTMELKKMPQDYIYALDIGTRNVVGVIAQIMDDENLKIVAHYAKNHRERAMYDGQIHDIDKVKKIIQEVTEKLSERTGFILDSVCIAAAGRALKTIKANVIAPLVEDMEINQNILDQLEAEGIQNAQNEMDQSVEGQEVNYYCVGYSAQSYSLDGITLSNPLGHKGNRLSLDLIATFLPRSVVDSLYTAVDKAGLSVKRLTLEPIAALAITVPEKFRLLNIALVDIGAGTSDIAITKDGLVYAYGMVDIAGDELTEALVSKYLLDFESAETLKIGLSTATEQTFTDIVGMTHSLTNDEIIAALEEKILSIANAIGEEILRINNEAPVAVFLIGGGSQLPSFSKHLANKLSVAEERVVIKTVESLEAIEFETEVLSGPKFITPLGIAYVSRDQERGDFLEITVNDSPVKLYNTKNLKVLDSLVLLGHNTRALLPQRGESVTVSINGIPKRFQGSAGEAAVVTLNGKQASLEDYIKTGDSVKITFAEVGEKAQPRLKDLVEAKEYVYYNDEPLYLIQDLKCNGEVVTEDIILDNDDSVTFTKLENFQHLADYVDVDISELLINGEVKPSDYKLQNEDYIELDRTPKIAEIVKESTAFSVSPKPSKNSVTVVVNGETKTISSDKEQIIFVDIFEAIDFDLSKAKGVIDLKLNGNTAHYVDVLKDGDNIEIAWR